MTLKMNYLDLKERLMKMRYTKRVNGKVITKPYRKDVIRNKLAKIEDIEERYGIDIVEFFEEYERLGYFKL